MYTFTSMIVSFVFLCVISYSEGQGLSCYQCIYNISYGAPTHNQACGEKPDDFDASRIGVQTCTANQQCMKAPAWIGSDKGELLVSIERRCSDPFNTGCVEFSDHTGYLRICTHLCNDKDNCNNAGAMTFNLMALFATFAMFLVLR